MAAIISGAAGPCLQTTGFSSPGGTEAKSGSGGLCAVKGLTGAGVQQGAPVVGGHQGGLQHKVGAA